MEIVLSSQVCIFVTKKKYFLPKMEISCGLLGYNGYYSVVEMDKDLPFQLGS
jgi:hypothetical protein